MNGYAEQKKLKCCANCKHSYYRIGLAPYCNNDKAWIKETVVIPTAICDFYEDKTNEE